MYDAIVSLSDLDDASILDDIFIVLCEKNAKNTLFNKNNNIRFKNKRLPQLFFHLCKSFQLNSETKYFALELFTVFANKFVQKYYTRKDKIKSFCSKSISYMFVCVQIASKMSNHYKTISQRSILTQVRKSHSSDRNFTKSDILAMELEILSTVEYDLNFVLPVDFLEILLCHVQKYLYSYHPQEISDCVKLKNISSSILDMVYVRHHQMFRFLDESLTHIAEDKLLLSISVVCVAIFLLGGKLIDSVSGHLSQRCAVNNDNILKLSCCIIEHLSSDDKEKLLC